jgi:hypothetical protein
MGRENDGSPVSLGACCAESDRDSVPNWKHVWAQYVFYFLFAVVKATVLLADINDFGEVNNIYKQCKLFMNFEVILMTSVKITTSF